jgi:alkanesulfonate monooxygenase SsuD/methylene tetrahydromethanopterin reductase-like flavin-dependent oxidoreductase (luciferase family)
MSHQGINTWAFEFHVIQGREVPNYEDPDLVQRSFDRNLERLVELEQCGFEGVFFSEHHFLNALSPVPNLLVAALAKMTSTMRIGVLGNVLPFHQPWRLAEELAMLDYLTDGRLEIGMSSGVPPEFLFVNIPEDQVRPRYTEIMDFLEAAQDHKYVTVDGDYYQYDDLPVMPRLRQADGRRHWVSAYSGATCASAAKRGYKAVTAYQSKERAKAAFDDYRAACEEVGRDHSPDDLGVRRQVHVCQSDAQAQEMHEMLLALDRIRIKAVFSEVFGRVMKAAGLDVMPQGVADSGAMDAASVVDSAVAGPDPFDVMQVSIEDEFIFGSPATVTERIVEQLRYVGAGNLMAYHYQSLEEPELDEHYRLFASILPDLRSADVGAPSAVS